MISIITLPLGKRPKLVNCGLAEHGLRGQEAYELPKLWCLHLYFYDVEMEAGGQTYHIVPGTLTVIPPRMRIVYKYAAKRHRHFFVHFGVRSHGAQGRFPLLQHVPDGADEILDRLQNMQRILTHNALHAEVLFWGLLWDIAEAGQRRPEGEKRAVSLFKAIDAFVEKRLPERTTAAQVAKHMGLSATHVNRVVKSSRGITTVQFIKRRRLQRAYRLLLHSTMPIKLVAAECGIDDLQQFNKLMRGGYGKSPRRLRDHELEGREPTWAMARE